MGWPILIDFHLGKCFWSMTAFVKFTLEVSESSFTTLSFEPHLITLIFPTNTNYELQTRTHLSNLDFETLILFYKQH